MVQKMSANNAVGVEHLRGAHEHHHDHDHHDHGYDDVDLPHSDDALISARRLSFRRNGRDILTGVNIEISSDEIVTLIGPNGAGKTSLVKLLLGLERPDRGEIIRKSGLVLGYVPQRFDIDRAIPLTVTRFLGLGREFDGGGSGRGPQRSRRGAHRRQPSFAAVWRRIATRAACPGIASGARRPGAGRTSAGGGLCRRGRPLPADQPAKEQTRHRHTAGQS